jgi:hypothetical protein
MQVTMNNETTSTGVSGTKFFGAIKSFVNKITKLFNRPQKPKFTYTTMLEAIEFIEWRTKYDQYRILNAVYTNTALQQYPELCIALGVHYPTLGYKNTRLNWSKFQVRTRELLLKDCENNTKINIEFTDNGFDRKLLKFFGDLSPRAKDLISRTKTADKTFAYKKMTSEDKKAYRILQRQLEKKLLVVALKYRGTDVDMLSLKHNLQAHDGLIQEDFENQISSVMTRVAEVPEVASVIDAPQGATEQFKVETTVKSVTKAEDIKKVVKDLNKMTIPKLKAFAKERGFKLSGRTTQISTIRAAIVRQLKEQISQQ